MRPTRYFGDRARSQRQAEIAPDICPYPSHEPRPQRFMWCAKDINPLLCQAPEESGADGAVRSLP
jgi:hypothetical protein